MRMLVFDQCPALGRVARRIRGVSVPGIGGYPSFIGWRQARPGIFGGVGMAWDNLGG